jgi:hypothetical protein
MKTVLYESVCPSCDMTHITVLAEEELADINEASDDDDGNLLCPDCEYAWVEFYGGTRE